MDCLTKLNNLQDYITRILDELQTVKAAMFTDDAPALYALLRYYKHMSNHTGRLGYKPDISNDLCAIIEAYINEDHERR